MESTRSRPGRETEEGCLIIRALHGLADFSPRREREERVGRYDSNLFMTSFGLIDTPLG